MYLTATADVGARTLCPPPSRKRSASWSGVSSTRASAPSVLVDALWGIVREKAEPAVLRKRLRQLAEFAVRGPTSRPAAVLHS
jgi:hypothetical protein